VALTNAQVVAGLSRLGLGTAPLGSSPDWQVWWGELDDATAIATIRTALDVGVGWIDTAPFYGWGRAERLVGQAIRGRRQAVKIFTKCGTVPDGRGGSREDTSPANVRNDLVNSLQRLGTDYVDVLQVHDHDSSVPIEETWGEIHRLIEEGKVLAGGLSNHSIDLMARAKATGPLSVVQHRYSLLHREVEFNGVLEWCRTRHVPFLAWSPLASGFLTVDFDPQTLDAQDFRRRERWAHEPDRSALRTLVSRLAEIGRLRGMAGHQVALGWVLRTPYVHAIVGARSPAEATVLRSTPRLDDHAIQAVDEALARSTLAE
jgi:aryl-alcohol dehydrogenase-like predicted oxidoreductase